MTQLTTAAAAGTLPLARRREGETRRAPGSRPAGRDDVIAELRRAVRLEGGGIVLSGPAGHGRTLLARLAAELARQSGRTAAVCRPAQVGRSDAALTLLAGAGPGPVVVVDDAQLLADDAARLLVTTAVAGRAVLVLTVRSGAPLPEVLGGIGSLPSFRCLELAPLDRGQAAAAVSALLGGAVETAAQERIWALTRGVPLHLAEYVKGARDEGTLCRPAAGPWQLDAGAPVPARLTAVVGQRVAGLGQAERDALDLLAVAGVVAGPELLRAGATPAALHELERRGLVRRVAHGRRTAAGPSDRLLREVLLQGQGGLRRRALGRRLDRAFAAGAGRRLEDPVRRAKVLLASGLPVPGELAPPAARNAAQLLAFPVARQVASGAGSGIEPRVIRARSLLCGGLWTDALDAVEDLLAEPPPTSGTAERVAAVALPALAAAGRTAEALAHGDAAFRSALARAGTAWSLELEELAYLLVRVHLLRGDLEAAGSAARQALDRAHRAHRPVELALWSAQLAEVHALGGDAAAAIRLASPVRRGTAAPGRYGALVGLLARRAACRALLDAGRTDLARRLPAAGREPAGGPVAVFGPEPRIRILLAEGQVEQAGQVARQRVREAAGAPALELQALHEYVRLGRSAEVAERVTGLLARCDGQAASAQAAHLLADARNDAPGLRAAARRWRDLGWRPRAEEAVQRAWALEARGGRDRAGLLTERETEVARLAARGLPSREIAGLLFLSVRTVDNYLGQVYRKLGIGSRSELAARLWTG